jgi:hypothetical protein
MKRTVIGILGVLLVLGVGTGVARAGSDLSNAVVVLHATPTSKVATACQSVSSGVDQDCTTYSSNYSSDMGASFLYLVVAHADTGVGGVSLGIQYPEADLDVGFNLCTDGLQFSNQDWPASGGGNRITWSTCGSNISDPDRQAVTEGGIQVLFGYFYVYAYGRDALFEVTPNTGLQSGAELVVGNCDAEEFDLDPMIAAGKMGYGTTQGFNPCTDVSVEPTTWGDLKSRFH